MFAVPGWNVNASVLKTQTDTKTPKGTGSARSDKQASTTEKQSRKRKRGPGSSKNVEVTDDNLGDLWKKYVEVKSLGKSEDGTKESKKEKKKKRKLEDGDGLKEDTVDGRKAETNGEREDHGISTSEKIEGAEEDKQASKSVEVNDHTENSDKISKPPPTPLSKAESKAKYEERKANAAQKREQKVLSRANGTLPQPRAAPPPTDTVKPVSTKASKPLTASNPPTTGKTSAPKTLPSQKPIHPAPQQHPPQPTPAPAPIPPTLTPLQHRMSQKLLSSRFRHLNETLYTTPASASAALFSSPQIYDSYHLGFRQQVSTWPENPIDAFIADFKLRGAVKPSRYHHRPEKRGGGGGGSKPGKGTEGIQPLPRCSPLNNNNNNKKPQCRIADLGCGDATLAATLLPLSGPTKLNLSIRSFDLSAGTAVQAPHASLVTVADITDLTKVGVADGSVDVAVCCLCLMGTDWVRVVGECARVVVAGGEVWVAEIRSRFVRKGGGKAGVAGGEEGEGREGETDVGGFVGVWERRGFKLVGGGGEGGNRMFVRMRFVRVREGGWGGKEGGGGGWGGGKGREEEEEVDVLEEGKVLKPCVYKTR